MDNVLVVIDGGYVEKLCKLVFADSEGTPKKVRWRSFTRRLAFECGGMLYDKPRYYNSTPYLSPEPTGEELERKQKREGFFDYLNNVAGLEVVTLPAKKTFNAQGRVEYRQRGVDVMLALDCFKLAAGGEVKTVALVSGDGDFLPLVRELKARGVEVCVYCFTGTNNYCKELFEEGNGKPLTWQHLS